LPWAGDVVGLENAPNLPYGAVAGFDAPGRREAALDDLLESRLQVYRLTLGGATTPVGRRQPLLEGCRRL